MPFGSSKARRNTRDENLEQSLMFGKRKLPGLFSGLVVIAGVKLPIPSRTRPISAPTPMVLRLKTWESRSPPDLKRDTSLVNDDQNRFDAERDEQPWRGVEQPGSSSGS